MSTKTEIYFSIFSDKISPGDISEFINLKGDKEIVKGEQIQKSALKYKYHIWSIGVQVSGIIEIDSYAGKLLDRLNPAVEKINKLYLKGDIKTELEIIISLGGNNTPSFHLDSELLKRINQLNAEIDIDLYVLPARINQAFTEN